MIKKMLNSADEILNIPAVDEKIKIEILNTPLYQCAPILEKENIENQVRFASPVSTNNWDTVTIVRAAMLNKSIAEKKTYPEAIDYTIEDDAANNTIYNVTGKFYPWEITTGGSGKNIWFKVCFSEGTFTYGDQKITLEENTEVTISVALSYFPIPQQPAKNGDYKLSVDNSSNSPCVSILSVDTKGSMQPITQTVFSSVLSKWFNSADTLDKFQPLFATVVINNNGSEDFSWLKPTYMSYAYRDASDLNEALFGVLCMTNDRDGREGVKQLPLAAMRPDDDLMYLINREVFVKYNYLPGLVQAIPNTTADNFTLGRDGLTVTANNLDLDEVSYAGSDYKPVLKEFSVSFDEERVSTSMQIDINISAGINVHSYVETEHTFNLSYNEKQEPIMVYENIGEPLVRNETVVSSGIVITEAIIDVILAVATAAISEAVEKVLQKIIIATVAAIIAATIGIIIHLIIEEVITEGVLDKLPSVSPMVNAGISPVEWPFIEKNTFDISDISYHGAFIFEGKVAIGHD